MQNKNKKDFFSTKELIKEPWFPVKSMLTIKKLVEQGELEAIDVSTNPERKRYRISIQSAKDFVERRKAK